MSDSDNIVQCAKCDHLICSLSELIYVVRGKDDVLLTIHPQYLESAESFSSNGKKSKQTITCNGCSNKIDSSILLYNSKGPFVICFGVKRLRFLGLVHSGDETWYSIPLLLNKSYFNYYQ